MKNHTSSRCEPSVSINNSTTSAEPQSNIRQLAAGAACWCPLVLLVFALNLSGCGGNGQETAEPQPDATGEAAQATTTEPETTLVDRPGGTADSAARTPRELVERYELPLSRTDPVIDGLYLGKVARGERGAGSILLLNDSDDPITIRQVDTTCGCTAVNAPRNRTLEPGESVEFDVTMSGQGTANQRLTKHVVVRTEDNRGFRIPVSVDVATFLETTPTNIARDDDGRAEIVIRATDNQPFRILSMTPPVIEEFPDEAKVEHRIVFENVDDFIEHGRTVAIFTLDHPRIQSTEVRLVGHLAREIALAGAERRRSEITERRPTSLLAAIRTNNIEAIDGILEHNPDALNEQNNMGVTPLMMAAGDGRTEIVRHLLEAGADLELANRAGRNALVLAAQSGHGEVVALLIEHGADVNHRDALGGTALLWSCSMGSAEVLRTLIEHGGDVNRADSHGRTPLMWASGFGDAERVALLLEAGADVTATDNDGMTALMYAAYAGSPDRIERLLADGSDVNASDSNGLTALGHAVSRGRGERILANVRLLVDAGADPTVKDNQGSSVLDHARQRDDELSNELLNLLTRTAERQPA